MFTSCTASNCGCLAFMPQCSQSRICAHCKHDWIPHALDSQNDRKNNPPPLEYMHPRAIFEVGSLILWKTNAIPIRLHILLDRLLGSLRKEELEQFLATFSWNYSGFSKGYMEQDDYSSKFCGWHMVDPKYEQLVVKQFLRFPTTRIMAAALLQDEQWMNTSQHECQSDEHSCPSLSAPSESSVFDDNTANYGGSGGGGENSQLRDKPICLLSKLGFRLAQQPTRNGTGGKVCLHEKIPAADEGMMSTTHETEQRNESVKGGAMKRRASEISSSDRDGEYYEKCKQFICDDQSRNHSSEGKAKPAKKRVRCVACMKTFCDKGALKIHYSAVHLREMHQCTVKGCNMLFSSRRSRNRHSANPNPKLHLPRSFMERHANNSSNQVLVRQSLVPELWKMVSKQDPALKSTDQCNQTTTNANGQGLEEFAAKLQMKVSDKNCGGGVPEFVKPPPVHREDVTLRCPNTTILAEYIKDDDDPLDLSVGRG